MEKNRGFGFNKFQNKLMALLLLGVLFPVTIVGGSSIISSSRSLTNLASQQMEIEGIDSAETLDLFIENIQGDVKYLSGSPPIQGIVRANSNEEKIDQRDNSTLQSWKDRLNIIFVAFIESKTYYDQLRYLDENGNELVRVDNKNGQAVVVKGNQLQNKKSQDYFTETMKLGRGEIYVSEINLNQENGQIERPYKPTIRYAVPIYSEQGQKKGIVIANILATPLFNIVANEEFKEKLNQEFFAVNHEGYYLSHPDTAKTWGFDLGHDAKLQKDIPDNIAQEIFTETSGVIETVVVNNEKYLLSYQNIVTDQNDKNKGFIIIYRTPHQLLFSPVKDFTFLAITITIVAVSGMFLLGMIILRKLVNSITETTNIVSSFSNQMISTVDEQEKMAAQQSSSVQQTTVTMDELSASSQQSAQQAEIAASGAKEALNLVEKGSQGVEYSVAEMDALKAKVQVIAQKINALSEQTHQIGSVSTLVSDVANQTNMLALNAAVEAVRAGENGKGFSVVATEIRKLADQSQKSAQQIGNLVNDIQKAINSTVIATNEGTKHVETGVKISEQTATIFQDIAQSINQIVENSQQIALTSKQQAIATQQVTETMNSLNQSAKQTAEGITQTKQGTQQLNQVVTKLQEVV
jgi:methyl-accepting chemotaxis protein